MIARFGSVRPRVQISSPRLKSTWLAFLANHVDLSRLRIRGLETAVHMALIREVHSLIIPAKVLDLPACR